MEEEDVGRADARHDPYAPAHVGAPSTQVSQVQPVGVNRRPHYIHPVSVLNPCNMNESQKIHHISSTGNGEPEASR